MASPWIRGVLFAVLAIVVFTAGALIYIDQIEFKPFWPGIRRIAAQVPGEESDLPERQRQAILKLLSQKGLDAQSQVDWQVSRQLRGALMLGALIHLRVRV